MTTPCTDRYCTRPADIRVGDRAICAHHYLQTTQERAS